MGVHESHCGQDDYTSCKYGDPDCPVFPISSENQIKDLKECIEWNNEKMLELCEEQLALKRQNDEYRQNIKKLEDKNDN